jgi:lysophospholipase L1-like esterase
VADGKLGMKPELATDGVHPTKAGYDIMAPLAERAIADALRQR